MYFLRARYLNTNTGRFHTQDSYEGRNGEPLTLHKYLYANGNPASYTDPSGYMGLIEQGQVGGMLIGMSNLDTFRVSAQGAVLNGVINGIRIYNSGKYLLYSMAASMPVWLGQIEKAANIATIGVGGIAVLSEILDRMALSSAQSGAFPAYPIRDRGRGSEAAAGANLGGNVSRVDHIEGNVGVQIYANSGTTEAQILNGLRGKLRSLRDAEQGRIYGTAEDGRSIDLRPGTLPAGSIGVLLQVDVETANIVQSASFSQKLLNLSKEFGRLVRVAPVRMR